MTTEQVVYTGTIGCQLHITAPADLTTNVKSVVITVRKPSGTLDEWTPTLVEYDSQTRISTISYVTVTGDLDESGNYRVQPVVTMDNDDVWPLGVAEWKIVGRFEVS